MKKLFFTSIFTFLLSSFWMAAQTESGSMMIGGTGGINFGDERSNLQLNPAVGFFVADQIAVGGMLNLRYSKVGEAKVTNFGIAPFGRYYFTDEMPVKFFGQALIGFNSIKPKGVDATNFTVFGLGVGMDYFFNNRVAFELIAGWNGSKTKDVDMLNTFGIAFGVQSFIGGAGDK